MKDPVRRTGEADADFLSRIGEFYKKNHPIQDETDEQLAKRSADFLEEYKREEEADDDDKDKKKKKKDASAKKDDNNADGKDGRGGVNYAAEILAIGRQANLSLESIEKGVRENCSPDEFRKRVFDELVRNAQQHPVSGSHGAGVDGGSGGGGDIPVDGNIIVGEDHGLSGRAAAMAEALTIRALTVRRTPAVVTDAQREWADSRGITDNVTLSWRIYDGKEQPKNPRVKEYLGKSIIYYNFERISDREQDSFRRRLHTQPQT